MSPLIGFPVWATNTFEVLSGQVERDRIDQTSPGLPAEALYSGPRPLPVRPGRLTANIAAYSHLCPAMVHRVANGIAGGLLLALVAAQDVRIQDHDGARRSFIRKGA